MRKEALPALVDSDDDDGDELAGVPALYDSSEEAEYEDEDEMFVPRVASRKRPGRPPAASNKAARKRKEKNDEPDHEFSITFSLLGDDLPLYLFHKGADYLDSVLTWFTCVYEQGDEENHWYAQACCGGSNNSKATLHAALKAKLGWTGVNKLGTTWNIVVKYLAYTNKVYAKSGMIGFNIFGKIGIFRRFHMQRKFANFKSTL
ncbi:hypothetical protein CYMTET_49967 [Cymbomonas tetramitiformis]|uniref:Uncharacterized protein n=1 Tax=Cymbomonas tetramitiformis TaxID=36881 RepID=A0AAE0BP53_9CHLO|nr:hypothetical protein CYMTET_49967 [Cymbomonas tetramitiformis]